MQYYLSNANASVIISNNFVPNVLLLSLELEL